MLATMRRQLQSLRQALANRNYREPPLVGQLRADPARILAWAGILPDRWQADLLREETRRVLMLCGRQMGKSTGAAALALKAALLRPRSLVLLLSPTRSEEHTSELQSLRHLVCRLLL